MPWRILYQSLFALFEVDFHSRLHAGDDCSKNVHTYNLRMDEEDEFKSKLSPAQYKVMRQGRREAPFTGKYWDNEDKGTYSCAACETPLFSSSSKFHTGEGWPNFHKALEDERIQFKQGADEEDRIEIRCAQCKSHLGYFIAGEKNYFRINSLSLNFEEQEDIDLDLPDQDDDSKDDEKKDENKKPDVQTQAAQMMGSWSSVLAGTLAGAILGSGSAFLYCKQNCAPAVIALTPTTTAQIIPTTPIQPSTGSSVSPVSPATSNTKPPRNSTGTLQAQQAQLEATSSPAETPASDGTSGSAADGTI